MMTWTTPRTTTLATMIHHTITTAIMVNNSITYNAFAKLYLTL